MITNNDNNYELANTTHHTKTKAPTHRTQTQDKHVNNTCAHTQTHTQQQNTQPKQ